MKIPKKKKKKYRVKAPLQLVCLLIFTTLHESETGLNPGTKPHTVPTDRNTLKYQPNLRGRKTTSQNFEHNNQQSE